MRNLTEKEVAVLQGRGCSSEDWGAIQIESPESLDYINNVHFSGKVSLGRFEKEFTLPGGLKKHSGVRNATLHNVTVGDDTLIENVSNYIANYDIGHDTYIENVDLVVNDGVCSFGNGVEVSVLNETGGREVKIFDRLSAQVAYVLAMYRHRHGLSERLNALIDQYAKERSSERGSIGSNVRIRNTRYIHGVRIGDAAVISGVNRLRNGSVMSNAVAPVCI
ncbi:MAG: DUF4954 family protein, partial [Bacteroidales bacterium]|nr:DUF4954 family protein [Bacteroidales bacterium]